MRSGRNNLLIIEEQTEFLQDFGEPEIAHSSTPRRLLKLYPECHLSLAIDDLRSFACYLAEASVADAVIRIIESGPVECIEIIHTQ